MRVTYDREAAALCGGDTGEEALKGKRTPGTGEAVGSIPAPPSSGESGHRSECLLTYCLADGRERPAPLQGERSGNAEVSNA